MRKKIKERDVQRTREVKATKQYNGKRNEVKFDIAIAKANDVNNSYASMARNASITNVL